MTVNVICPCGAELNIEDGSEDRIVPVLTLWFEHHAGHRQLRELARGGRV